MGRSTVGCRRLLGVAVACWSAAAELDTATGPAALLAVGRCSGSVGGFGAGRFEVGSGCCAARRGAGLAVRPAVGGSLAPLPPWRGGSLTPGAPCDLKNSAQLASTESGSAEYCSYISWNSQSLAPKSALLSSAGLEDGEWSGAMATIAFFRSVPSRSGSPASLGEHRTRVDEPDARPCPQYLNIRKRCRLARHVG